jgi:hypothetical protein
LASAHAVDTAVQDDAVTNAGYRGAVAPNLWFGGPALSPSAGAMVLRDARGNVVDSLNYGLLADPWAAEGYQAVSGTGEGGCRVASPGPAARGRGAPPVFESNRSAGRLPDGADSDSNCTDFHLQPATTLPLGANAGATDLKVTGVNDFAAGQAVLVGTGPEQERATIAAVGSGGATTISEAVAAGAAVIPVASPLGFAAGASITVGDGAGRETARITAIGGGRGGARLTVSSPLARAHASGTPVAGSGITVTSALTKAHGAGTPVTTDLPTPGAPNRYPERR